MPPMEERSMKLGFCGLGLMGAPMVKRLLAAGHSVQVWNRSAAKAQPLAALGARVVQTPAQAAEGAEGVFMCVLDTAAVEAVVFGAEGIAKANGLPWLVDHSSILPEATCTLADRLRAASGAEWIDAPVSGGVGGAEAGTLAVMAGGSAQHLDAAAKAMRAYAANITHMGPTGAGQVTKLCNQTIVATTVAAIAEALGLAESNGIDGSKLAAALAGGWADSRLLQVFLPRMREAQAQSIGALSTMLKDVDNVLAVAKASHTPMPVAGSVQQTMRLACAQGLAEAELSALISVIRPDKLAQFRRQAGGGA